MNAADGSEQTKLTNNDAHDRNPSWSPDGNKIAFESARDGNREIYVMNADGSGQMRLTNTSITTGNEEPDWSPDGTKIIFTTTRDDPPAGNFLPPGNSIYTMNVDGSGQASLFAGNLSFESHSPHFSPDGTKVVFSGGGFEEGVVVYTINADGTGQRALTSIAESPDWGVQPRSTPDQQSVLTVNAVSQDNKVLHVYTKILSADGTVLQRGFTPMNFTGSLGTEYTVVVADYVAREFDHWENNSTDRRRTVSLSADTTVTASYDTGSSVTDYAPLTYNDTAGKPDLTVNAVSLDGSKELSMWTIIKLENNIGKAASNSTSTYTVAASNYKDRAFDHWQDGSTDRVRTLAISEDTTITAYYRTAG